MESPNDPLTCFWKTIHAFHVLTHFFPKYLELIEIAIFHGLGSVEDECYF